MQQRVKLNKRQIKEDKFTIFMLRSRGWFQDNWQFVAIGVVAVILLSVAAVYYAQSRVAGDQAAATKFAEALLNYRQGNNQVAILGMQTVLDEHGGSPSAEQATYLLGNLNLRQRNYTEAIRYYEMYLSKYDGSKMTRAASLAGIATAYENQTQLEQAADYYQRAIDEYPDGPLDGDYTFSLMRCYLELGDRESAQHYLDQISENYEGTELVNRATRMFMAKYPG